ncbi:S41 family peptidase [Chloracidobacterium sp. MS 40/45]|uniref:S41 family peptidase n=1 Tax=Chloracidobacterium aggregatum TaxID=2851959 RepID=UPI001B8D136A|nr:S41 family peptidase [Chloracidobacterium aggregatum]QUW00868.1 S41 family peptidase [Chloracidobacterium sp. MS 40/45]
MSMFFHRHFARLSLLLMVVSAVCGGVLMRWTASGWGSRLGPPEQQQRAELERSIREAQEVVVENYVTETPPDQLTKAAIHGMLRVLDPHSNFFDSKEFQEMRTEQHSRFYGIGVSIARRHDRVYILATIENTPAARAGLRAGDAIIKVDDESATDWTTRQVLEKVRGERGEPVSITVERLGVPKPLTFSIVRDAVPLPSIRTAFMARPGIGYIALSGGFNTTTEDELRRAMNELTAQGMQSLLLDLRGNPGGLLPQAVSVADVFLRRDQKIVAVRGRLGYSGEEAREYRAKNTAPFEKPVVVLIDHNSASASEIVSGALQDHDRALIVGEPSFGKGLVQRVFELPFGAGLTLTTAKYYTPSGRCIQRSYTSGLLYAYYAHQSPEDTPTGEAVATDTGRTVYGGGGITPDIIVKPQTFSSLQSRLSDATFAFARHLAAGLVPGLVNYRIERTDYRHQLRDSDFPMTDKVVAAFREFLKSEPQFATLESAVTPNLDFVRNQIRQHLATAAYGTEAGFRVQLMTDPQFLRAIESVPQAVELAQRAWLVTGTGQRR